MDGRDGKHRFCAPRVYKNRLIGGGRQAQILCPLGHKNRLLGYPSLRPPNRFSLTIFFQKKNFFFCCLTDAFTYDIMIFSEKNLLLIYAPPLVQASW